MKLPELPRYDIYGLSIASAVPLAAPASPAGTRPDATVNWAEGAMPSSPAEGRTDGFVDLRALERGGFLLSYAGLCAFEISASLRDVHVHALSLEGRGMAPVFLNASVPAYLLALRGEPTLHGAAVEVGGAATVFVGASGSGKSTLCALASTAGASMLSDDLVRLDLRGSGVFAYRGGGAVRLRAGRVPGLGDLDEDDRASRSADGRYVLPLAPSRRAAVPLARVFVLSLRAPWSPTPRRLDPGEALLRLTANLRAPEWWNEAAAGATLRALAPVARSVPVYEVGRVDAPPPDEVLAALGVLDGGRPGGSQDAEPLGAVSNADEA